MNKIPPKNTVKLTEKTVKALVATGNFQKFSDEKGLYLYVTKGGLKSWRYDYRVGGLRKTVTFGQYPDVSLSDARKKHLEARANLANGGDPAGKRKVEKLERQNLQSNTFDAIAKLWYDGKSSRRSAVWCQTHTLYLNRHLSPGIGNLPLVEITSKTLLELLEKVRSISGAKTADRVRQTAVQVFDYGRRKLKVTHNVGRPVFCVLVDQGCHFSLAGPRRRN
ncbi:MAG: Arm DNA-binding domain-containing protein [Pseudomonadota bacterium]